MAAHDRLESVSRLIRYSLIRMTTAAGSGHLSSSLSAVELMSGLMFSGIFRADLKYPDYPNNDRLIFSKGHAAPLLYALYAAAGAIPAAKLNTLRKFGSRLEGHPMPGFRYTEVPTGSLGQGLSAALGEALAARFDGLSYKTYCLLGDSEMAEGQIWEAIQLAGYLKVNTLVGVIDFNRLGQSGPTMLGTNAKALANRIRSFGWETIVIDGHDLTQIIRAYRTAVKSKTKPVMIIAKTVKGRGVHFIENKNGWHGKTLNATQAGDALVALGPVDTKLRMTVKPPSRRRPIRLKKKSVRAIPYRPGDQVSVRMALGEGLVRLAPAHPELVVLDGEVKNSTYTQLFEKKYPRQFIEGYIAEQNLVGLSGGLSRRGRLPVLATFAAFLTRAFDQLRMQSYARTPAIYIGTHVGVDIGQDGASQMGLQDIAMFRSVEHSVILSPSDAVSAQKLLERSLHTRSMTYLRAIRGTTPVIYPASRSFVIGGSQTLHSSKRDRCTIVASGITVHAALAAADQLAKKNIPVRVIDCYSIKPIDRQTLVRAARETHHLIVVEDHYPEGGLSEAVRSALGRQAGAVTSLAVTKTPKSGAPDALLRYERIDAAAIVRAVSKVQRR